MSIGSRVSESKQKVFKYLRHEIIGNSMYVHFLDEDGEPTAFVFGNTRSKREYVVLACAWGGRMYDGAPPHHVGFMLFREGSPTQPVGSPEDFREVSHSLNVELSREEARELGWATLNFMNRENDNESTRVLAF